ncbi:MAG: hypothetical protein MIN69_11010 [Methylorubrum extorquens]|uniref:hypothetical protein n=1 Tax=Methylorubrum extorquens TaxID=408 RepID=UPI001300FA4D
MRTTPPAVPRGRRGRPHRLDGAVATPPNALPTDTTTALNGVSRAKPPVTIRQVEGGPARFRPVSGLGRSRA